MKFSDRDHARRMEVKGKYAADDKGYVFWKEALKLAIVLIVIVFLIWRGSVP